MNEHVAHEDQPVREADPSREVFLTSRDVLGLLPRLGPVPEDQPKEDGLGDKEPEAAEHGHQNDEPVDVSRIGRTLLKRLDHGISSWCLRG